MTSRASCDVFGACGSSSSWVTLSVRRFRIFLIIVHCGALILISLSKLTMI